MKWILALLALIFAGAVAADYWPEAITPDGVEPRWAAEDMIFNGVPMRILTFNYAPGVDALRRFYQNTWDRDGVDHKAVRQGKWWVLSSLEGDYYTTVQITDIGAGAYAQVGVSRINELRTSAPPGEGVPALPRSEVISDIIATDAGRTSRTVIVRNQHSVGSNYSYYLNHYRSHNWTAVRKNLDQTRRGARIGFAKDDRELDIVIKREGRMVSVMSVEVRR